MITPFQVFGLITAYLLGSIPTAVWIGKFFYKIDVREHGSGNAGATNTFRVLGKRAGLPVLLIDIFKGWSAANLAFFISVEAPGSKDYTEMQIAFGIAALVGHVFPILAAFRGGKGIATLLGVMLAIHPGSALIAVCVFAVVFFAFRYVSLSSILAASSLPLSLMFILPTRVPSLVLFGFFATLMVIITHQKNIERLFRNQESKVSLGKKDVEEEDIETA
ncbi:MAG TPA: glycerol-3-phosphate 1-O-acyltransferase PlsY [Bacteroidia bacterium]|jgi:glycerol-3-phosphate acyltransferase PlsY